MRTKEHGTPIILSERTFNLLDKDVLPCEFKELGRIPVRGIAEPVGVYTIV
ncbi:MAG: hypothetical protein U1D96_03180 [Eubacteriales bacterium]|nr:hypothetical protein [Bacillota bacterium]MBV1726656.1 hypothetical protein [Desulforudis sp.]MDP3051848.1 hypothetical protein [Eubacteriales bacterium]MDQ7789327.1 hypothetical protein [Clostridia bacterium]MBV1735145.1 hypothetical protein [Desulforudis sp.]